MKTSKTNLIAILTIGAIALAATSASAGGFSFGGGKSGGGGGGGGGFKVSFGGGNHNKHNHKNHKHHGHHHHKFHKYYHYPVKKYYEPTYVVYDQCYHPYYSSCHVYPGDTWYTIAKRCYGHSHLWKHIANYNNLSLSSSALVPGQQLQLPVVNANGSLGVSNAPAAAGFAPQAGSLGPQGAPIGPQAQPMAPQGMPQGMPTGLSTGSPAPQAADSSIQPTNPTTPAAPAVNVRPISDEPKRPIVTIGSTLALDGKSLGTEKGIVRLRISGLAMPVEVLEWNDSSVTIQLPMLDLTDAMNADLEVLRADGRLASKSAIELTPAATRLALGN